MSQRSRVTIRALPSTGEKSLDRSSSSGIRRTTDFRVVQQEFADEGVARFLASTPVTMRRVGASSFHHFPDTYWEPFCAELGRKLSLAEVVDEEAASSLQHSS